MVGIGGAIRVLYLLSLGGWKVLSRELSISSGALRSMPPRDGGPDESRSWPGDCDEGRYCKIATEALKKMIARGKDSHELVEIINDGLAGKSKDPLPPDVAQRLHHLDSAQLTGKEETLEEFKALFAAIYQEASRRAESLPSRAEARKRRKSDAMGDEDNGAPKNDTVPTSALFSADWLAYELNGGAEDLPCVRVPIVSGSDLLTRLLPRALYLAHEGDLGELAAGVDYQGARALSAEFAEERGMRLVELVNRARGLCAGPGARPLSRLLAIEASYFEGRADRRRATQARAVIERFADGSAPRLLAALLLLCITDEAGTAMVLTSAQVR